MNPFRLRAWTAAFAPADDPLAPQRLRATYVFGLMALLFLLPFAVNSLLQGRYLLAGVILVLVVTLGLQTIVILRRRPPPIPNAVFLVGAILAIGVATRQLGLMGALWTYPCVLFVYFTVPRRKAILWNVLLVGAVTAVVYRYTSAPEAVRVAVTLVLTIVVGNTILNVIRDLERRLMEHAITDPLTGAFNRRHLDARLGEAIERSRRKAMPASLLLIDIDHFKRINDQHGHATGDSVLKEVVAVIQDRARKFDSLFRMGGEEFLLLLTDATESDATGVAEQLRRAIAGHPFVPGAAVTVSIGVCQLDATDTVDSWINRTDETLYAAKHAGRNCVVGPAMATVRQAHA
jgi:diguanylate cyclase (GGDEF)-like protein